MLVWDDDALILQQKQNMLRQIKAPPPSKNKVQEGACLTHNSPVLNILAGAAASYSASARNGRWQSKRLFFSAGRPKRPSIARHGGWMTITTP